MRLSDSYQAVAFGQPIRGKGLVRRKAVANYVTGNKRDAIRWVRRETLPLGHGASGAVYASNNALVYQCTVINGENGRPRLRVDEL